MEAVNFHSLKLNRPIGLMDTLNFISLFSARELLITND